MAIVDDLKNELPDTQDKDIRSLQRKLATAKANLSAVKERHEAAENELATVSKKLELYEATAGEFSHPPIPKGKVKRNGTATALIVATDWHSEQRVNPATVNGQNEFNLEIADRRITNLWQKAVYLTEAARHLSKIKQCVLACLGDMITGYIHDELLETNFASPPAATIWVQERLCAGIEYLLKHGGFDSIEVPCTVGNHGRTTQRMRVATRSQNSYEWLIYQNVAREFRKERRVRFIINDAYHTYLDIQGWKCRFHHGDGMQYQGGVGGLSIPVNKAIAQWNKSIRADYDFFGHWHHFLWHKSWVCCPPLIGYDAWSLWIKAEFDIPAQAFGVIERDRGLVEMRRIFVESARNNPAVSAAGSNQVFCKGERHG